MLKDICILLNTEIIMGRFTHRYIIIFLLNVSRILFVNLPRNFMFEYPPKD